MRQKDLQVKNHPEINTEAMCVCCGDSVLREGVANLVASGVTVQNELSTLGTEHQWGYLENKIH